MGKFTRFSNQIATCNFISRLTSGDLAQKEQLITEFKTHINSIEDHLDISNNYNLISDPNFELFELLPEYYKFIQDILDQALKEDQFFNDSDKNSINKSRQVLERLLNKISNEEYYIGNDGKLYKNENLKNKKYFIQSNVELFDKANKQEIENEYKFYRRCRNAYIVILIGLPIIVGILECLFFDKFEYIHPDTEAISAFKKISDAKKYTDLSSYGYFFYIFKNIFFRSFIYLPYILIAFHMKKLASVTLDNINKKQTQQYIIENFERLTNTVGDSSKDKFQELLFSYFNGNIEFSNSSEKGIDEYFSAFKIFSSMMPHDGTKKD